MAATTTRKTPTKPRPRKAPPVPAPAADTRMPARHVKCPDTVWLPATAQAKLEGYSGISDLVRDLLRDYNAGKRMA